MSHVSNTHDGGPTYLWLAAIPFSFFLALAWGLTRFPLPWHFDAEWVPSLAISLAFRIDGLSAQMLALITGIGTGIFVYASGYLAHEPRRGRLFLVLLLFMLAMIGAVTADNLILLFLFWELTSLTSFLLVGFNHEDTHARAAARQAPSILVRRKATFFKPFSKACFAPVYKRAPLISMPIKLVFGYFSAS